MLLLTLHDPVLSQTEEPIGVSGDGASLSSLSLPDGKILLSYLNPTLGQLKVAENSSGSWIVSTLASGFGNASSTAFVSLAGEIHLFALNSTNATIFHFRKSGISPWANLGTVSTAASGKISAAARGSQLLVSYMSAFGGDLILSTRNGTTWSAQVVDSAPEVVGSESALALSSSLEIAIAYFDQTKMVPKVARSTTGTSWTIESLSFPSAFFGRMPSTQFGPDGTLYVLSGDVIQNTIIGGKGLILGQRKVGGTWEMERIGFPATAGISGHLLNSGSVVSAAIVSKLGAVSEVVHAIRGENGLWGGPTLARSESDVFDQVATGVNSSNIRSWFVSLTNGSGRTLKKLSGAPVFTVDPPPPPPDPRLGGDSDGDGLSDADEVLRGTNPQVADTDGDGVSDGTELSQGTNPLDPNSYISINGNRLCTLWIKKKGISAAVELTNRSNAPIQASLTLNNRSGAPVVQGDLAISQTALVALDTFAKGVRGSHFLFCADHTGPTGTLSGRYIESSLNSKSSRQRSLARPLSAVSLKRAGSGSQRLTFSALGSLKNRRLKETVRFSVLNLSDGTLVGTISVRDKRGKVKQSLRTSIPAGGYSLSSLQLQKLAGGGTIEWSPSEQGGDALTVLDQQLETEIKRKRVVSKVRQQFGKLPSEYRRMKKARRRG